MGEDLRWRYPELAELADGPELYAITREIESRDLAIDRWRERTEKAEEEARRFRYEVEQWHAAYGESALPGTLARLRKAEGAVVRVRAEADRLSAETHPTHDHLCPDDVRKRLLAALDSQETDRG